MRKRLLLIGFLFGIFVLLNGLISRVNAIEKSEYLSFGESSYFTPVVEVGDIIYWSFETRNDKFNVKVSIYENKIHEIISENKTSDSGSYNVQTGFEELMFINLDREWYRDGWIKIEISINLPLSDDSDPEPTDPEPTDPEPNDPLQLLF